MPAEAAVRQPHRELLAPPVRYRAGYGAVAPAASPAGVALKPPAHLARADGRRIGPRARRRPARRSGGLPVPRRRAGAVRREGRRPPIASALLRRPAAPPDRPDG